MRPTDLPCFPAVSVLHRDGWSQPPPNPRQTRATALHVARESAGKIAIPPKKPVLTVVADREGAQFVWVSLARPALEECRIKVLRKIREEVQCPPKKSAPCSRLPRTYRVRIKLTESSGPEQTTTRLTRPTCRRSIPFIPGVTHYVQKLRVRQPRHGLCGSYCPQSGGPTR